jgi:hypothetical protein
MRKSAIDLMETIRETRPQSEKLALGTIEWSTLEIRPPKPGMPNSLMVDVVCICGATRAKIAGTVLRQLAGIGASGVFNGGCKSCQKNVSHRGDNILETKPPKEVIGDCTIHWDSVRSGVGRLGKRMVVVECGGCGDTRKIRVGSVVSIVSRNTGLCMACANIRRQAEKSHLWRGGRTKTVTGYVNVRIPKDSPFISMAAATGYVAEHRLVVAQRIGRPLRSYEHVHHINRVKDDNRDENLMLVNRTDHWLITRMEKRIETLEQILADNGLSIPA